MLIKCIEERGKLGRQGVQNHLWLRGHACLQDQVIDSKVQDGMTL